MQFEKTQIYSTPQYNWRRLFACCTLFDLLQFAVLLKVMFNATFFIYLFFPSFLGQISKFRSK